MVKSGFMLQYMVHPVCELGLRIAIGLEPHAGLESHAGCVIEPKGMLSQEQFWNSQKFRGLFSPTREMLTISMATISKGWVGCISNKDGGGSACGDVIWQISQLLIQSQMTSSMWGHQK
uniref:Uncharacterized protein n=1 Tax=Romanomermis culicivorax TaxID=13658 RepID=A0A915KI56_ROMCU